MPVSRALRRLLHVRALEEELGKAALAAARAELMRLQNALVSTELRARRGRELVVASTRSGDSADRSVGLEEARIALRLAGAFAAEIASAEAKVGHLESAYLAQRVERRQAETLLENAEAEESEQTAHKSQQELDDWFLSRGQDSNREKEDGGDIVP
jgi:hypothetical protein